MLDNVVTALEDWKADQRPGDSASHNLNGVVRKTTNHVEGTELLLLGRLLRGRARRTGPGGVARSRVHGSRVRFGALKELLVLTPGGSTVGTVASVHRWYLALP